jgi:hypothetical protein
MPAVHTGEDAGGHVSGKSPHLRALSESTTNNTKQKHDLTPLKPTSDPTDFSIAFDELFNSGIKSTTKWCSLCPSPAQYKCRALTNGSPCGMLLCEHDMVLFTGVYNSDLQEMLRHIEDASSDQRPLGLRADYELLKEDGLLMKFILG